MDRARASSWKEEVDFLCDPGGGFPCSPGRSGHTHDLPASRTPCRRRKTRASATWSPTVLHLALGFIPVSWTLLLRKNLLRCTAMPSVNSPGVPAKKIIQEEMSARIWGRQRGLVSSRSAPAAPIAHQAGSKSCLSYSFSPCNIPWSM